MWSALSIKFNNSAASAKLFATSKPFFILLLSSSDIFKFTNSCLNWSNWLSNKLLRSNLRSVLVILISSRAWFKVTLPLFAISSNCVLTVSINSVAELWSLNALAGRAFPFSSVPSILYPITLLAVLLPSVFLSLTIRSNSVSIESTNIFNVASVILVTPFLVSTARNTGMYDISPVLDDSNTLSKEGARATLTSSSNWFMYSTKESNLPDLVFTKAV